MATQKEVLTRAKQGEPDAIAALMNPTLAKQKSRVRVLRQGNKYKLLVESAQVPPQAATVKWIVQGLKKLALPNIEIAIIYGKSQQNSKPDWQQAVLFNPSSGQASSPPSSSQSLAEAPPSGQSPSDPSSPCSTANASPVAAQSAVTASANEHPSPASPTELSETPLDLTEYCFTRNKSLLKGDLTLPAEAVIQLVLSFHQLNNAHKQAVLPHVDKLFRKPTPIEDDTLSSEAKAWLEQIPALEGPAVRKAGIWLSRYCLEPVATVAQLDISKPEPEPDLEEKEGPEESASPSFPTTHNHAPTPNGPSRRMASDPPGQVNAAPTSLENTSNLPLWVIPTVWTACLLLFVVLGIGSARATDYNFPICANTLATSESCSLAVQLAGDEEFMAEAVDLAQPILTPDLKESALARCSEQGYWMTSLNDSVTGTTLLPNREDVVTITASAAEEVFPGVLLTHLSQTDSNADNASIRMACLSYATTYEFDDFEADEQAIPETDLVELGADEIPENWPADPYNGLIEITRSFEKFEGATNLFVSVTANTLFTAIGLTVAVILCACYTCPTLNGIYKTSLALGIIETLLLMIPGVGVLSGIALEVTAIGAASLCVKEFNVDWTYGYPSLMLGAVTILAIRFLLNVMMYGAIAYFVFF